MARTAVVAAVALFAVMLQPAAAGEQAAQRAVTFPLARMYGYSTPTITISKGDNVVFTNLDIDRHDFVQDVAADGRGGKANVHWCKAGHSDGHDHGHGGTCPIFWTPLIGLQQSAPVEGLDRVKPGETYTFFCTLHHSMKGTLIVRE